MNRKLLPVIMMLVAGVITCIATYVRNYTMLEKLVALFITLILFYGLGCLVKGVFDSFDKQNEQKRMEEEAAAKEAEKAEQEANEQKQA